MEYSYTPTNIRKFLVGMSRLWLSKLGINTVPGWYTEQIEWRKKIQKKECAEAGKCVVCGCHSEGKLMIPEACDTGCYPAIREGRKAWELFKKENTVTYFTEEDDTYTVHFADASKIILPNSSKGNFGKLYESTNLINIKSLWA